MTTEADPVAALQACANVVSDLLAHSIQTKGIHQVMYWQAVAADADPVVALLACAGVAGDPLAALDPD